eukprot:353520-Chlamydomonas_euryale.AAC.3
MPPSWPYQPRQADRQRAPPAHGPPPGQRQRPSTRCQAASPNSLQQLAPANAPGLRPKLRPQPAPNDSPTSMDPGMLLKRERQRRI